MNFVVKSSVCLDFINKAKIFLPVTAISLFNCRSYSQPAYVNKVGKEPLIYRNLGQQLQNAANKFGDNLAVVSCSDHTTLTFKEIKSQSEILAIQLQELNLKRGDHLGIWAPNTIQWLISFFAAALGGFPLVCINPALQALELRYALQKAKVRALITMDLHGKQNFYEVLTQSMPEIQFANSETLHCEKLPDLKMVVVKSDNNLSGVYMYDGLLQQTVTASQVQNLNSKLEDISPESACNIQFTSGTTGQPKAAVLTHFNFINEAHIFGDRLNLREQYKRFCITVPFFHVFGLAAIISALEYGATMVLPSATFNAAAALDAIEREHCNIIFGTPTMYVDILDQQRSLKRSLESLEIGVVGGAACSPQLHKKVRRELSLNEMLVAYGMSEATSAIFMQDGSEQQTHAQQTVGGLFEHGEAKVINSQGETVKFGEAGELCVRGFYNMKGYFEDEKKTKEVLSLDGWLKTGDEFILEESGVGRIVGRKKDMIIRGGENIYPKEIEDYLDTHDDILESQVIGVPDERMGEELCAFLRLRENVVIGVDDVRSFCTGKIAHFKVPRYIRVVHDFPKTTSGKIQKFKLREIFK